jgi:hypothetical protein
MVGLTTEVHILSWIASLWRRCRALGYSGGCIGLVLVFGTAEPIDMTRNLGPLHGYFLLAIGVDIARLIASHVTVAGGPRLRDALFTRRTRQARRRIYEVES